MNKGWIMAFFTRDIVFSMTADEVSISDIIPAYIFCSYSINNCTCIIMTCSTPLLFSGLEILEIGTSVYTTGCTHFRRVVLRTNRRIVYTVKGTTWAVTAIADIGFL